MHLHSLIERSATLPTVPRVTQRVIASFGSEEVTVGEIAELIEADPVLSAKLLRLANSSYFQMSRSVESVDDAIRVLGLAMVRRLVLAGGLVAAFADFPGVDLQRFWMHSLYTACSARWLGEQLQVNRDQVFTLGLLQGIGQLQLHSAAPAAAVALDRQAPVLSAGRAALESASLGFNFLDVSAALARLWNFPASLVEPLSHIAAPLQAAVLCVPASLVHLGAWHARHTLVGATPDEAAADYPQALGQQLGIAPGWHRAVAAPGQTLPPIPPMHELTHGLDDILS